MRIITRKLHRAFPEFDEYTDEECMRFLEQVRLQEWFLGACIAGGVVAVVVSIIGLVITLPRLFTALSMTFRGVLTASEQQFLATLVILVLGLFVPAISVLLTRDVITRFAVRRFLRKARCPHCGYSMLGQTVIGDEVRCPECGALSSLTELGLTRAEELLPPGVRPRGDGSATRRGSE